MSMQNDVMKMAPLPDGIAIAAGETVSLSPGGVHIMFMQLAKPFVEGESVPVTLKFEKAGEVTLDLSISGVGADSAPDMHDMKM
jgi:copper(I)-binding protein